MSKNRNRKQRSQNEMKQTPPKDSSKTQVNNVVCVSSESSENTSVEEKRIAAKDGIIKPIVDRFDFQLLITIIIFFVSAWVYLNGVICNFAESDPIDLQMSHIFVHYVLTLVLIYSVVLSAIKSIYLIDNKNGDYNKWFTLFLDSWFWVLLICFATILLSRTFPYEWFFFLILFCIYIIIKMIDIKFSKLFIVLSVICFIIGFPLFLSTMTSTIVNVEVETDKPFYSFSDKVLITYSARGYACKHKFVGLGEGIDYPDDFSDKGLIVINAYEIKNNEVSIGTVSPTTGFSNYLKYSYYKIFGFAPPYINIRKNDTVAIKKYSHFTPKSIYVKP